MHILKEIMKSLEHCSTASIYASLKKLSASIFYDLITLEQDNGIKFGIDYIQFSEAIDTLETLSEIENTFRELFLSIHNALKGPAAAKKGNVVDSVLDYINEHYHDINLSSKSIADSIDISSRYLNQLFFAQVHQSLQVYITEFRIKKAKALLKETDMTIEQIVTFVGWTNLKYFYKIFKKQTGLTPSQYRNKHMK